jgi:hypothetical protein
LRSRQRNSQANRPDTLSCHASCVSIESRQSRPLKRIQWGVCLRLFYASPSTAPFAAHRCDTTPKARSDFKIRASGFPITLFATVTVFAFALVVDALSRTVRCLRPREASSKRQGDGQRFQKKAMKTPKKKNEAKAPANVRPSQSVSKTNTLPKIDFTLRYANRALNTENLLALLRRETPNFFELAEVVGKWVWIQFEGKQPSEVTMILSQLGFHWNNTRQ